MKGLITNLSFFSLNYFSIKAATYESLFRISSIFTSYFGKSEIMFHEV